MSNARLYIVSTPIGNLQDITIRAIYILLTTPIILAEDKRQTSKLLQHIKAYQALLPQMHDNNNMQKLSRKQEVISFHNHNEHKYTPKILEYLAQGYDVALVSDAGTPLIADPGYLLVQAYQKIQGSIIPIPGSCALITALSACAIPMNNFTFLGFLPSKKNERYDMLQQIRLSPYTHHCYVCYVPPHDCQKILLDIDAIFGQEQYELILARELTKIYEEFVRGRAHDICDYLLKNHKMKGEMVLMIYYTHPPLSHQHQTQQAIDLITLCSKLHMRHKDIVAFVQNYSNLPKKTLYTLALEVTQSG